MLTSLIATVINTFNYFRIGRRKAVLILSIWMSIFAISSSFPPNYAVFAALRFLTGMGGIALMQSLMIWGKLTSFI